MSKRTRLTRLMFTVLGGFALISLWQFVMVLPIHSGVVTVTIAPLCIYADLAVAKTVNNATPNEGDTIVYTIALTNNGPHDATSVRLTDALSTGVTYVSHLESQGTYTNSLWTVGNLANTMSATLTITATVDSGTCGTTITNTANGLTADQSDPNPDNNEASVGINPTSAMYGLYLPIIYNQICDPYFDDFSDYNTNWKIDNEGNLQSGYSVGEEYFIYNKISRLNPVQAPTSSAIRYTVEVDARWDNANVGYEYGLLFGQTNFPVPTYLFGVDSTNKKYRLFYIYSYDDNNIDWDCITDPCWIDSSIISSTLNHLKVECDGETIRLYINDEDNPLPVWQYDDSDIPSCSGQVGLFIQSSPTTPNARAYFDNFQVSCPVE